MSPSPAEVGTAVGAVLAVGASAVAAAIRYWPKPAALPPLPDPPPPPRVIAPSEADVAVLKSEMSRAKDDIDETRCELRAINEKLDAHTGDLGTIKGQLSLLLSTRTH